MSVALLCLVFLRRPKCSNCVVSAVCEVCYVCCFFFATDQAKQKQGVNPRCQYVVIIFFESKCMITQKIEVYEPKWFLEH